MGSEGSSQNGGTSRSSRGSFRELATAWTQHVQRLVSEQDKDIAESSVWGIHDYIAALYIRDRVSVARESGQEIISEKDMSQLDLVDRDFTVYTELDHGSLLTKIEPVEPDDSAWWWRRIPRKGPVRQELATYIKG